MPRSKTLLGINIALNSARELTQYIYIYVTRNVLVPGKAYNYTPM